MDGWVARAAVAVREEQRGCEMAKVALEVEMPARVGMDVAVVVAEASEGSDFYCTSDGTINFISQSLTDALFLTYRLIREQLQESLQYTCLTQNCLMRK